MGINIRMRDVWWKYRKGTGTEHRLLTCCVIGFIAGRLFDLRQTDRTILMKPKPDDRDVGTVGKIQRRRLPHLADSLLHQRKIGLGPRRGPIGHSLRRSWSFRLLGYETSSF